MDTALMVTMEVRLFGELWSWAVAVGGGGQMPDTVTWTVYGKYSAGNRV